MLLESLKVVIIDKRLFDGTQRVEQSDKIRTNCTHIEWYKTLQAHIFGDTSSGGVI